MRLGGPKSQSGHITAEKKSLVPVGIQTLHHPSHSLVIILNELPLNGGNRWKWSTGTI